MPFGQMRTEFVEGAGAMVEGKVVEGTVVEGTVVDGTTVVDGNTVVDGEMLGVRPTMLLPESALSPRPGAGPTVLHWLGGVPVTLGVGARGCGDAPVSCQEHRASCQQHRVSRPAAPGAEQRRRRARRPGRPLRRRSIARKGMARSRRAWRKSPCNEAERAITQGSFRQSRGKMAPSPRKPTVPSEIRSRRTISR